MVQGHVTLNQVSDKGITLILDARDKNPNLTLSQGQVGPAGNGTATLSWRDSEGLKALADLLHKLAALP